MFSGQAGGLSSKLDFATSETTTQNYDSSISTSLVKALVSLRQSSASNNGKTIISSKLDQNPFNLKSIAPLMTRNADSKLDFSTVGVVCIDGRCNSTELNNQAQKQASDSLSTDVIVQVVTNVKDINNKTSAAADDNDVPVVVGYAGTGIKNSEVDSAINRRVDGTGEVTFQTGTTGKENNPNYNVYQLGRENDIGQHQVPYFNPGFNTHYFGEQPPPHFVWYRRRNDYGNARNPQAFYGANRPYKPYNNWQIKYSTATPVASPTGWTSTTGCDCSNQGKWYPSFGPNQPTPSAPVNNKMAPLN